MLDTIEAVHSRKFPVRFDQGRHPRAKIGFVVLASEQTVEADCFKLAPPGVGIHLSRIAVPQDVDVAGLKTMEASLGAAAALLNPYDNLDVSCYTCNSSIRICAAPDLRGLALCGVDPGAGRARRQAGVTCRGGHTLPPRGQVTRIVGSEQSCVPLLSRHPEDSTISN